MTSDLYSCAALGLSQAETSQVSSLRSKILELVEAEKNGSRQPKYELIPSTNRHWRSICAEKSEQHFPEYKLYANQPPSSNSPSLQPESWTDAHLHRFLRARKGDINKAAELFLLRLHWLRTFGVDDLAQIHPMPYNHQISTIIPHSWHRCDREGRPIYIQKTGILNAKDFVGRISDNKLALTHIHFMAEMTELFAENSAKFGRNVEQSIHIIDLKGVGLGHRKPIKFFAITAYIDQNFYPEQLKAIYMINSPSFFPIFWRMCKVFLDPVTQEKIKVLGANYQETLLNDLGKENLPVEYGGSCRCEEKEGGCIPPLKPVELEEDAGAEEISAEIEQEMAGAKAQSVHIGAGKQYIQSFEITNNSSNSSNGTINSEIEGEVGKNSFVANEALITELFVWWSFIIEAKDINFTVKFYPNNSNNNVDSKENHVILAQPTQKLKAKSHPGEIRGVYAVPSGLNGRIELILDNKMSYFSGKNVKFKAGIKQITQNVNNSGNSSGQQQEGVRPSNGDEKDNI
jgi:hypothetical protein